jgi:hypothetical protein
MKKFNLFIVVLVLISLITDAQSVSRSEKQSAKKNNSLHQTVARQEIKKISDKKHTAKSAIKKTDVISARTPK